MGGGFRPTWKRQRRTGLCAASATCATCAWCNRSPRRQGRFRAHGSSHTGVLRRGRVFSRIFFQHICSSPHTSVNTNGPFLLSFSLGPAEQWSPVWGEVSERRGLYSLRNSPSDTLAAVEGGSRQKLALGVPTRPHALPPCSHWGLHSDPWEERQAAQWELAGGHGDSSRVTRCRSCPVPT